MEDFEANEDCVEIQRESLGSIHDWKWEKRDWRWFLVMSAFPGSTSLSGNNQVCNFNEQTNMIIASFMYISWLSTQIWATTARTWTPWRHWVYVLTWLDLFFIACFNHSQSAFGHSVVQVSICLSIKDYDCDPRLHELLLGEGTCTFNDYLREFKNLCVTSWNDVNFPIIFRIVCGKHWFL